MFFNITNIESAKASIETIRKYNNNLKSQNDSLATDLSTIQSHWQSDTEDKNSYVKELEKTIENISKLSSIIDSFINRIDEFIVNSEKTANNR